MSLDYISSSGELIPALRDISFSIGRQEVVGILGESGSGKSSLSQAILRLLPSNAQIVQGTVEFNGRNLLNIRERELRRVRGAGIALISQEPALALNPVLSIARQVIDVLRAHRTVSHQQAKEQARGMLREVGFSEPDRILSAYPHQLSGGQRQRAAIAQALICSPELLIADEPLSSLDTVTQAEILELLAKLKRDLKLSMIFITHNAGALSALADRVLVMENGRVRAQGSLAEVGAADNSDVYVRGLFFPDKALTERSSQLQKSANAKPLLQVTKLNKHFHQRRLFSRHKFTVQALQDIDLQLAEGSSSAVIGRSGSGKTTLARCIAGFEVPDSGEVRFSSGATQQHRDVQLMFQDAGTALNPRFTAIEAITEPLDIAAEFSPAQRKDRALQLIEEVELDPQWHSRKVGEFSGGQRQRLALARALAASPKLLILDESLSGLDLPLQARMLRLLLDLQARHRLTYLHITHDLSFLPLFADEVVVMEAGKIVELCSPAALSNSSHPATRALVEASERLHIPGLEAVL